MKIVDHDLLTRILRTRPLLAASVLYAIGCLIAYFVSIPASVALAIGAALLIPAVFPKMRRYRSLLIATSFLFLGAANFTCHWEALTPLVPREDAHISGRVCTEPDYRESTERSILLLENVTIDGIQQHGKLRLYLRSDDPEQLRASAIPIGTNIISTGHIWEASKSTNPGQFDFSRYLRINGITGYATAKLEETVFNGTDLNLGNLPARIRSAISSRIDVLFPEQSAIAKAFLIGDRSDLSEDDREAFSAAGIAHLLAISGMHISLLSYVLMLFLNRFLNRRTAFHFTLSLLFLYGILIGFPASLTRALIMFAVSGFAGIAGYHNDPLTSLTLSMLICLLLSPLQILSTGFALSFGATAGIIMLQKPITELLHVDNLIKKSSSKVKMPLHIKTAGRIVQMLAVTLSAQLAIIPIVVYSFGSQSVLSFFTGLLAVPIAMVGYLLSIIGIITSIAPIISISDKLFAVLSEIAHFAAALPVSTVRIARFPIWLSILWAITCVLSSDLCKFKITFRRFIPLMIIPAIVISNLCAYIDSVPTTVMFMDAGQADCAVVRSHGKVYLIDTGDDYSPVSDYLQAMNYKVDGVFISHPHSDHTGGLAAILDFSTPEKIYISRNHDSYFIDESVSDILNRCREAGSEIVELSAGDHIELAPEVSIDVLHPPAGFQTNSANEDSMLLYLKCGSATALFTGDAPAEVLTDVAADADILKVSHHGAADSLNEQLLEAVSPSACILSVGYNTYGHPKAETLGLIELSHARIYRTDICGAITCRLNTDGKISIQTHMKQEKTYDSQ